MAGHFAVVALNLKDQCFQYIDSLYGPHEKNGWYMYKRMVKGIKKLWSDASQDMEHPMNPLSIDGFQLHYMKTPKQDNG